MCVLARKCTLVFSLACWTESVVSKSLVNIELLKTYNYVRRLWSLRNNNNNNNNGKVIHWEMCKKFKFDHANKWYMHNQASILKNYMHKLLWDFDIHTDNLISARRQHLIIINNKKKKKKICKIVDFAVPADHRIKLKECEKKDKYLDLARELNKLWNMKVTIIPIVIGALGTVTKGLLNGLEDLEVGDEWRPSKR